MVKHSISDSILNGKSKHDLTLDRHAMHGIIDAALGD
jgi:hypothetical protein